MFRLLWITLRSGETRLTVYSSVWLQIPIQFVMQSSAPVSYSRAHWLSYFISLLNMYLTIAFFIPIEKSILIAH